MMYQRFMVLSLCILMGLMVVACSAEGPIAAVTPIVLESAEFGTEATIATVGDPSPSDAVATIAAYPEASEAAKGPTPTPTFTPTPLPSSYPEPADSTAETSEVAGQIVVEESSPARFDEPTLEPIPIMEQVPRGLALNAAREADRASGSEPFDPDTYDDEPVVLRFGDFFDNYDPWSDEAPVLSEKILALDGKMVIMEGYMAPPLQLGLDWFMMTRQPLGACPFHSSTATVTEDILLVYVEGEEFPFSWRPLRVMGELHVGGTVDPVTGMASLVRLYAAESDIREITWSGQ